MLIIHNFHSLSTCFFSSSNDWVTWLTCSSPCCCRTWTFFFNTSKYGEISIIVQFHDIFNAYNQKALVDSINLDLNNFQCNKKSPWKFVNLFLRDVWKCWDWKGLYAFCIHWDFIISFQLCCKLFPSLKN